MEPVGGWLWVWFLGSEGFLRYDAWCMIIVCAVVVEMVGGMVVRVGVRAGAVVVGLDVVEIVGLLWA